MHATHQINSRLQVTGFPLNILIPMSYYLFPKTLELHTFNISRHLVIGCLYDGCL